MPRPIKVLANVLVDSRPRYAEFTADGSKVWVTSEVGGTVSVIDAKTFKILNVIHFDVQGVRPELISPVGITFTKDGKRAFISLGKANRLGVVDTSNYNVVGYVLVGQRPWHTALSPDGATIYSANGESNDITAVDVASLRPLKSVPVGRLPWGLAIRP